MCISRFQRAQRRTQLCSQIRTGTCADSPNLLHEYIELCQCPCTDSHCKYVLQHELYKTLMDTVSDSLVPRYWRKYCLDHVYKPLNSLAQLPEGHNQRKALSRMRYEVRTLSHYFLGA